MPEPSSQGRRRRGRRATPEQRTALMAVSAVVAVACMVAGTHPTGLWWADAIYSGGAGVALVLAGSRARRWSLIVGSAVVAGGALGPALLLGLLALGLSVFLVGQNRRDRVYGGVIGGLVAVCAFHLTISLFIGSATLLGGIAAVVILASGYRNSSRGARRASRIGVAVAFGLVLAATVMVGIVGLSTASDLQHGVDATQSGVSKAQNGQEAAAAGDFDRAATFLGRSSRRANAWWVGVGRLVPVLGQNLRVVQDVADAGAQLTRSAADIARHVDYDRLQLPGGGIDTKLLATFRQPVVATAQTLARADQSVAAVVSPWNVGPLQDRLTTFRTNVGQLRRQAALAALAVDRAPAMLGADGVRHYLVLLGDPAEARDLGGHLGNWAELSADGGHLALDRVGVPNDLSLSGAPDRAELLAGLPPSLSEMKPLDYPQNWAANPDMTIVERLSAKLYERKTGVHIDGVMYADPTAFADFLSITGPMPVIGLPTPVSASNAVQFLTSTQFTAFPSEAASNAATTQLVHDVFARLTSVQLPGPKQLSTLFLPAVREGRFKISSSHRPDAPLLSSLGLDGVLSIPDGGDVLGIIDRNANPSKIDTYLHRSTAVDVEWNPTTGDITETVDVTLRNDAPATGLPATVIGNGAGLPPGTNLTDLALLTTSQLDQAEVDGKAADVHPVYDGSYWRQTVRVQLAPGQQRVVRYELTGSLPPSSEYQLFVIGQPLVNTGTITIHLRPTSGRIEPGPGMRSNGTSGTVSLQDGVDTRVAIRVAK